MSEMCGFSLVPIWETHMPGDEELLKRIRQLEQENSELQDKLDLIYSIVAPESEEDESDDPDGLVRIGGVN